MTDSSKTDKSRYPWRTIYLLVLGFLLLQIILYYWITIYWR